MFEKNGNQDGFKHRNSPMRMSLGSRIVSNVNVSNDHVTTWKTLHIIGHFISLRKLLDTQSGCRWFKTPWRQYDVIAMHFVVFFSGCGGTWQAPSGVITSPNYPGDYGDDNNCVYVIYVYNSGHVTLRFDHFDLESDSNCQYDSLKVWLCI